MTIRTVVLGAIAAAMLLALAGGAAVALRSISFSRREISKLGSVTFSSPGVFSVICDVGMSKTLNTNPVGKAAHGSVGAATLRVLQGRCAGGTAEFLRAETPRNLNYLGFTGTLPNITGVVFEITEVEVLVSALGGLARCLYRGNQEEMFIVSGGATRELRLLEEPPLILFMTLGGLTCPQRMSMSGVLNGTPVGVTLV